MKKIPKKTFYTISDVKRIFEERGCKLLSTEFRRQKDKLEYICSCGNKSQITFDKFLRGQTCQKCKGIKSASKNKHSYEHVYKFFEERGAQLLAKEYKNGHDRMPYVCECGTKSEISFFKFREGQRCYKCKGRKISEKLSGANHPLYKHDKSDEDRIRDRKYPEYYAWRRAVFERDDYTCQCCGERGVVINAHHIEAYSRVEKLRTSVDNGVTLCERCHTDYHRDFFRNDADSDSFHEFMYGEYRDPWYAGEVFDD